MLPASEMPYMLIDPGRLIANTIYGLQELKLDEDTNSLIVFKLIRNIISATCLDDKPESEKKFCEDIANYLDEIKKEAKTNEVDPPTGSFDMS